MKQITTALALGTLVLGSATVRADLNAGLIAHFPINEGGRDFLGEVLSGTSAQYHSPHGFAHATWWFDPTATRFSPGFDEYFESQPQIGNGITDELTLSAHINPENFFDWVGIVTKGVNQGPYSMGVMQDGGLSFVANSYGPTGGAGSGDWRSNTKMTTNQWYHVAVTYDGSKVRFYINGTKDSNEPEVALTFGTVAEPLIIGADLPGGDEYYWGRLRDLAIYSRALEDSEIAQLAAGQSPNVANVGSGYTGLWIGQAVLDEVKQAGSSEFTKAGGSFTERVILHVDAGGIARLLPAATLMKTRVTAPALPVTVVVTRPELLANYDGITPRGGKLVGQRFSSATIPMAGDSTLLSKNGEELSATLDLAAADPLNPFRHKYHPDLRNGFALGRVVTLTLPSADSPSDHTVTGTMQESISGLHKVTLEARGPVTFTRVSTSGTLNDQ